MQHAATSCLSCCCCGCCSNNRELFQNKRVCCCLCQTSSQVKGQFQDSVYNHDVPALFLAHEIKTKVMIKRELEQTSGDQNDQTDRNHPQEKRFDIPGVCSVCINRSDGHFLKQTLVHTVRSAGCARLTDFRAALIKGTKDRSTAWSIRQQTQGKNYFCTVVCVFCLVIPHLQRQSLPPRRQLRKHLPSKIFIMLSQGLLQV